MCDIPKPFPEGRVARLCRDGMRDLLYRLAFSLPPSLRFRFVTPPSSDGGINYTRLETTSSVSESSLSVGSADTSPVGRGLKCAASLPLQGEVSFVQTKEFAQTFLFAQSKAPSLGGVSRCSRDGVGLKDK